MRPDPHSFFDPSQGVTTHADLVFDVDFDTRTIAGTATLTFAKPHAAGPLDLDTRDLVIVSVVDANGAPMRYEVAPPEPIFGSRLRLFPPAGSASVTIAFRTTPAASALQWLAPAQTTGKKHPYLFSQCQAIHARSLVPLQDSPGARITYQAKVTVPRGLRALMSAAWSDDHEGSATRTTWRFEMTQPIPPYLLALAAGDIAGRDLTTRSRVWAEPEILDSAAWEFVDVGRMMEGAEALFGPYDWERFDLLVMPPSFPYGGMENPRLTFLTPTLIAGDRSLVDVVAHELAHSWTGNLVSNASANDFWLNEGFTVYAERRILEKLYGSEHATLQANVGRLELDQEIARFGLDSPLTKLRTDLAGIDPDEVFSIIPYEKGFLFLTLLERTSGRNAFDGFLETYLSRFRFRSITTADFEATLEEVIPGLLEKVGGKHWLDDPGIPANAPAFTSSRLNRITALAKEWPAGTRPDEGEAARWTANEWQLYLRALPTTIDLPGAEWLDRTFALTGRRNLEVACAWLAIAASSGHAPARDRIRDVLLSVGRMRYLKPLYRALASRADSLEFAKKVFAEAQSGYHYIAASGIRQILAEAKPA